MDTAEQIKIIRKLANRALMEELLYRVNDIDHEEPYDFVDAFDDVFNWMDVQSGTFARSFIYNVRDIAIAIGWYVVITEDEISRTICTSGKAYSFRHRGLKYKFVSKG